MPKPKRLYGNGPGQVYKCCFWTGRVGRDYADFATWGEAYRWVCIELHLRAMNSKLYP